MLRHDVFNSNPSKQWITNLIHYGVATTVTPTYNTTKISNESSSHQLICSAPGNEIAKTFFFLQFYCTHNYPLFCIKNNQNVKFIPITTHVPTYVPSHFIIRICYEMHVICCLNVALSIQLHPTINISTWYPLKFACRCCW